MPKTLAFTLLIFYFVIAVGANDNEPCNCDDDGFWSVHSILECQRVSDFLIAVAYFSIPIELLYFISCSNFPFKWVLVQFIAFIVLCGLTHLLNAWTEYGQQSFQLMLWLTIAKFLTALVSCATTITLLTLFPLLLKWKVREIFLEQNVLELNEEVGLMKKQKEASWHVRMLTKEIRKSLDKHNILYTTLVELSKTLDLHNCAVWMPNENRTKINLTHELKPTSSERISIPITDRDVFDIKKSKGVKILNRDSVLAVASGGGSEQAGAVAAIRMPMLRVSNFKGGTPEMIDTRYAILVLVLPKMNSRNWNSGELELIEAVADQVAVALSHAAVLEESQLMREKLAEKNRELQQAKQNAMMASQARNSFQKVISYGMRRPMHSILGLLSMFHDENMQSEQKTIVETLTKTSNVLSTLINDVMVISEKDHGRFNLDIGPFRLHSIIKQAFCLGKCLCASKGFGFEINVQGSLPEHVMGDERRTFQVILHMVGYFLNICDGGGTVFFRVIFENSGEGKNDRTLGMWKANALDEYLRVKFEIELRERSTSLIGSSSTKYSSSQRQNDNEISLSFSMCKKIVQMMQGNIWITPNSDGFAQTVTLVLKFQTCPSYANGRALIPHRNSPENPNPDPQFKGLRVLLADDDGVNRIVTKKLLEKLGCEVTAVSSGFECLSAITPADNRFQIVILDLYMPEMDGFEVAMRIRKYHSHNWPLIIAVTASAEDDVWERCLQLGMNGLIRKPVLLQRLAEELRRVLQQAGEGLL